MAGAFSTPHSDHSNLEVVPAGLEPAPLHQDWSDLSQKELHYQQAWADVSNPEETVPQNDKPKQRILGLTVRWFWAIVIILVVVLAAGIGGGVSAGLAAQRQTSSVASDQAAGSSSTPSPPSPSSPLSTSSTSLEPTGVSTVSTSSESATKTTSSASQVTSKAPTDGGCPDINGSSFTPRDAAGKTIPLSKGEPAQSFLRYCSTNWPSGAKYGNPGLRDIMKIYQPSLEDCIAACASYNVNYKANAGSDMTGLCRAVTVVKMDGEFCYLKNDTGRVEFVNSKQPELFSSAMLLSN